METVIGVVATIVVAAICHFFAMRSTKRENGEIKEELRRFVEELRDTAPQRQEELKEPFAPGVPAPPNETVELHAQREKLLWLEAAFGLPASGVTEAHPDWRPPPGSPPASVVFFPPGSGVGSGTG